MTLEEKRDMILNMKEFYKNKPRNLFKDKYPEAFAPLNDEYANYFVHFMLNLEILGLVSGVYYRLTDGGALFIDMFGYLINL